MLIIKMDDGSLHKFNENEYTDYDIVQDFIVVKKDDRWIGVFDRSHFISLVYNEKGGK